jgi:plasmid stabilization system protein ParE
LASSGHPGASREWLRPGLRLHVFQPFSIYYRMTVDSIRIVHIIRGSRELDHIDFMSDED